MQQLEETFAALAGYFGLLAEPTRLKILHAICGNERSVGEIVRVTGAGQTNVSRHLALLHGAGLVGRRKARNQVFYRVTDPSFLDLCRTVCTGMADRIDGGEALRAGLLGLVASHVRAEAVAGAPTTPPGVPRPARSEHRRRAP
jgi:DNA-binding transcriptional ArsR family regulator